MQFLEPFKKTTCYSLSISRLAACIWIIFFNLKGMKWGYVSYHFLYCYINYCILCNEKAGEKPEKNRAKPWQHYQSLRSISFIPLSLVTHSVISQIYTNTEYSQHSQLPLCVAKNSQPIKLWAIWWRPFSLANQNWATFWMVLKIGSALPHIYNLHCKLLNKVNKTLTVCIMWLLEILKIEWPK